MNPWQEYENAIKNGTITVELFEKLLKIAKDAKHEQYSLSQKIETATCILHGA